MVAECGAIVAIIGIMLYMFIRSGRRVFTVLLWPLLLVPAFHLLGMVLYYFWGRNIPMGFATFAVSMDVFGLVLSALLFGGLSRAIIPTAGRRFYLGLCMGFSTVLTGVLVNYLLKII
ncbi:hypothetical protein U6B65_11300 [Oscillospiraceae bacterium MB08-C2-2]|nr:hypothetical protein U6B65_11300 [Oscillospiraceae bacterium MB08-C2-2]